MASVLRFPTATRPPDWQERERALDVRASWIVEAPAGSGKTGLLIQRFLKLLAEESVTDPAQVLAITFTTKATSEMRERVFAQLATAAAGREPANAFDRETRPMAEAVLARDQALGWGLLADPRRMNIRTIDSVCAQIARALPVLSGAGGGQSPVEDSAELYKDAARRTLGLLGGTDRSLTGALELLMLHRDGNLADCEALIAEMLAWRDQWGELVPLSKADLDDTYLDEVVLPKIERALEQAICRALTGVRRAAPPAILNELTQLAAEMARSEGYKGAPSPIALCRKLRTAPGDAAADLDHWRALVHLLITASTKNWRGGFNKNQVMFEIEPRHKEELKEIVALLRDETTLRDELCSVMKLPPPRYPREQWQVTKALFRVLSRALVELQIVFAERGECDFSEVGLLARGALRRNAALDDLAIAGIELRHLLVDEMQDTSTSQYELIQLLTQSWDGHSQTVFLVGDPKQSIYLFRQARVERFVRTMLDGRLGEIAVGTLRLTANFRSQRGLVEAFNDDFSRLFPREADPERPEEVPYVEANAVREATEALGEVWHAEVIPYSDDKAACALAKRSRTRSDAQDIRRIVEGWRTRPLPEGRTTPWKIAVLVRARTHLTEVVAAFKAASIPYRAVKIEALGERQEILDLLALTRALLHPADRVAWFAVLRAPWCGLTLADLHMLAGSDDRAWAKLSVSELILQRGELLSLDGIARLERLWPVLDAAVGQRGRLPVAAWVERTWRSLGADAYATPEQMGNIRRYLRLLDELEEPGGLRLAELTRRLGKLYAEPSAQPGAVDLMTIHGAKGLEWDVVLVPSLERTGQNSRGRLLTWMEIESDGGDEIAHGILAPIGGKGLGTPELNAWIRSIDAARDAAERKRLFYVACTRAREELHLFAAPTMTQKGEVARVANTLLQSAWAAAEQHLRPAESKLPVEDEEPFVLALAASAAPVPPTLQRIPAGWVASPDAAILPYGKPLRPGGDRFERPDGSFAARAFGNATHGFLDLLAARIAAGDSAPALLADLPGWQTRIETVLRSAGLPGPSVAQTAARVLRALSNTLEDPHGRWLLAAHAGAASEQALASAGESGLRLDRTFMAGPEPLAPGVATRWVVDFKTATPGREDVEEFLLSERTKYAAQMATYAKEFDGSVRVGLYYPLLPRLAWWVVE